MPPRPTSRPTSKSPSRRLACGSSLADGMAAPGMTRMRTEYRRTWLVVGDGQRLKKGPDLLSQGSDGLFEGGARPRTEQMSIANISARPIIAVFPDSQMAI